MPLGAWLGDLLDWRLVFALLSGLSLVLLAWVRFAIPDVPGQARDRRLPVRGVLRLPGIRPVLAVLLAWILAHNVLYTYVAPFLAAAEAGLRVDVALLAFGVASVVGIWGTGLLIDGRLRVLALASLALFLAALLLLAMAHGSPVVSLTGLVLWGLSFGGAPTILQTALANAADQHADVAQSMLVTVFNLAVAGGGVIGGLVVDRAGAQGLPWVVLPMAAAALVVVGRSVGPGFGRTVPR